MINVPLMRRVLEYIQEHPEEHDQNSWAEMTPCGTTYCFAGHAVVMAGHQLDWGPIDDGWDATDFVKTPVSVGDCMSRDIRSVAAHELGLDEDQEAQFFYDATTIEALWDLANHCTQGEIEIPENMKEID